MDIDTIMKDHSRLTATVLDFESHMVSICMNDYVVSVYMRADWRICCWLACQADSTWLQADITQCCDEWTVTATASGSVS